MKKSKMHIGWNHSIKKENNTSIFASISIKIYGRIQRNWWQLCPLVGRGTGQTEDRNRKELPYTCKYFLIFQSYECITYMKATMKHLQLLIRTDYHAQSPQCTLHLVDSNTTYITKFNWNKITTHPQLNLWFCNESNSYILFFNEV